MSKKFYQFVLIVLVFLSVPQVQASEPPARLGINTNEGFGGFGFNIEINSAEGYPEVVGVIENAPAQRAGLKLGDLVTHVDGESLDGKSLNSVLKKIRGELGVASELTIMRDGSLSPIKFNITREIIKLPVKNSQKSDDYIWLILMLIAAALLFVVQSGKSKRSLEGAEEQK